MRSFVLAVAFSREATSTSDSSLLPSSSSGLRVRQTLYIAAANALWYPIFASCFGLGEEARPAEPKRCAIFPSSPSGTRLGISSKATRACSTDSFPSVSALPVPPSSASTSLAWVLPSPQSSDSKPFAGAPPASPSSPASLKPTQDSSIDWEDAPGPSRSTQNEVPASRWRWRPMWWPQTAHARESQCLAAPLSVRSEAAVRSISGISNPAPCMLSHRRVAFCRTSSRFSRASLRLRRLVVFIARASM
mmetsp:Transcript_8566/g.21063  ORF Transcript_8566/g.21063 Transcript_8566/m.21063 type:complete len:248 (-) Transcript_8566:287-1030(-)